VEETETEKGEILTETQEGKETNKKCQKDIDQKEKS